MFIAGFRAIAKPLYNLTHKDTEFKWEEQHKQAFQKIYNAVTLDPVLLLLDPSKPFEIETNASDFAIAAQLS